MKTLSEKDSRFVIMRLCLSAILWILWRTESLLDNGDYVSFISFLSNFVVMPVDVDSSSTLCHFAEFASANEA